MTALDQTSFSNLDDREQAFGEALDPYKLERHGLSDYADATMAKSGDAGG